MNAEPRRAAPLHTQYPYLAIVKFERFVREVACPTEQEAERYIANILAKQKAGYFVTATAIVRTPLWRLRNAET